jgi:hypothetical protein
MHQKPIKLKRRGNQPKTIIIENDFTPIQKLGAIISGPALLVAFFVVLFLEKEFNTSSLSLEFVIVCSVFSIPFAFFISYNLWKAVGTKIILTDQKIIRKSPSGSEFHLYWRDVKTINISESNHCIHLIFSRKKRSVAFDNANRICCPPGALLSTFFNNKYLSGEAAVLIQNKIHQYKIRVKGNGTSLDEIVRKTSKSLQGLNRPAVPPPLPTGRKRLPAGSSSSQTPTPK